MSESSTTEGQRVLVVVDDPDLGELLARLFDHAGWTPELALSAASGLTELQDANPPFALVVIDLSVPTSNLKTLTTIRDTGGMRSTRVLICSQDPAGRGAAWISGTDGFILHPFRAEDYVAEATAVVARPDDDRHDHRQRQIGLSTPGAT